MIGVAVFREYRAPRPRDLQQPEQLSGPRSEREESSSMQDSCINCAALGSAQRAPAPRREEKLGTGHGERESSYASWTDFRRASDSPAELVSIWYDSRASLVTRGIIPGRPYAEPNPFPGFRFAPDPRG